MCVCVRCARRACSYISLRDAYTPPLHRFARTDLLQNILFSTPIAASSQYHTSRRVTTIPLQQKDAARARIQQWLSFPPTGKSAGPAVENAKKEKRQRGWHTVRGVAQCVYRRGISSSTHSIAHTRGGVQSTRESARTLLSVRGYELTCVYDTSSSATHSLSLSLAAAAAPGKTSTTTRSERAAAAAGSPPSTRAYTHRHLLRGLWIGVCMCAAPAPRAHVFLRSLPLLYRAALDPDSLLRAYSTLLSLPLFTPFSLARSRFISRTYIYETSLLLPSSYSCERAPPLYLSRLAVFPLALLAPVDCTARAAAGASIALHAPARWDGVYSPTRGRYIAIWCIIELEDIWARGWRREGGQRYDGWRHLAISLFLCDHSRYMAIWALWNTLRVFAG